MARSLLIALLALTAVAWPVSASGPLAWAPEPSYDPVTVEQTEDGATITLWVPDPSGLACLGLDCSASSSLRASSDAGEPCPAAAIAAENKFPGWDVRLDPNGCVRRFIEDQLPPSDLLDLLRFIDQA